MLHSPRTIRILGLRGLAVLLSLTSIACRDTLAPVAPPDVRLEAPPTARVDLVRGTPLRFTQLAAAAIHACGVTEGGAIYCWGYNEYGQLGDGSKTTRTRPTRVAGTQVYKAVAASHRHACGLTTGGKIYCWGSNHHGQLGIGTLAVLDSPLPVPVAIAGTFTSITGGEDDTCAITAERALYCWGDNTLNKLGVPAAPVDRPTRIEVGGQVDAATIGEKYLCVSTEGVVRCMGWLPFTFGPFSYVVPPATTWTTLAGPIAVGGAMSRISAGPSATCTIIETDAYCRGNNLWGQLGVGPHSEWSPDWLPVSGGVRFREIALGRYHTCGVAATGLLRVNAPSRRSLAGPVYCWGDSSYGALGIGATNSLLELPKLVSSGVDFYSLVLGGAFTCALSSDGLAYCWGDNDVGMLGTGDLEERLVPTPVVAP